MKSRQCTLTSFQQLAVSERKKIACNVHKLLILLFHGLVSSLRLVIECNVTR